MEFFHFSRHFMGIICFNFIATLHTSTSLSPNDTWLWKSVAFSLTIIIIPGSYFESFNSRTYYISILIPLISMRLRKNTASYRINVSLKVYFFSTKCEMLNQQHGDGDTQQKRIEAKIKKKKTRQSFHMYNKCVSFKFRKLFDRL